MSGAAAAAVDACLARIDAGNPKIFAFLRTDPGAREAAAAVDAGRVTGPLAGIPVAVKDNLLTAGLETTCGSRLLEGFVPSRDATAVARMRAAGAIVLGKTNLDEFAMGSSTENSAFGPTRNPWDPTRVPGGSSGGSAAAVASGMAPCALGSDTGGSVRQPAAFCGVVGLKPTYGRVSRSGLVAFGSSLDQVGPIALRAVDAARLLEAIAGHDPEDASSAVEPSPEAVAACGRGVGGMRIGLARHLLPGTDPEVASAVEEAAARLEAAGAAIEEIELPNARHAIPVYYLVATAEASSNLARFDGVRYGVRVDPGEGLRAMYRATRGRGFGDEVKRRILLGTFALSEGYYDAYYGKAMRVRTLVRRDFTRLYDAGFDAILMPTVPAPAFRLGEKTADPLAMYLSDVFTATANLAGVPAISVPCGRTDSGLPRAVQLLARDFDEESLFRAAGVLESVFPPSLAPLDAGTA